MEKVKEPDNQVDLYQCQRCKNDTDTDGWYCDSCTRSHEVDFDIEEDEYNWKGENVCPWCYNQLIDIAKSKTKGGQK